MRWGRGSVVVWWKHSLNITGSDPVKRTISAQIVSVTARTIDIDIPDLYRPEFIRMFRESYGSQHVAQFVAFRDLWSKTGRFVFQKRYGVPEYELANITKNQFSRYANDSLWKI